MRSWWELPVRFEVFGFFFGVSHVGVLSLTKLIIHARGIRSERQRNEVGNIFNVRVM